MKAPQISEMNLIKISLAGIILSLVLLYFYPTSQTFDVVNITILDKNDFQMQGLYCKHVELFANGFSQYSINESYTLNGNWYGDAFTIV